MPGGAKGRIANKSKRCLTAWPPILGVNKSELERVISFHLWTTNLIVKLNTLSQEEVASVSPESTDEYVRAMISRLSFDARNGTLDALIASGNLEIISDPKLRALLVEWKNLVQDASEEKNIIQGLSEKVRERSIKLGGPWRISLQDASSNPGFKNVDWAGYKQISPQADLDEIVNDSELMALARWKGGATNVYISELINLQTCAEEISALIEETLN